MKQRLSFDEFVPYASDTIGVEVKIHHCRTGKDNNRLFIRRTENGIIAFCHHCGQSGRYRDNKPKSFVAIKEKYNTFREPAATADSVEYVSRRTSFPKDSLGYLDGGWSVKAKLWIKQYPLTSTELIELGVVYSPNKGRIYFPVYDNGSLLGYQARAIEAAGAKWLSLYKDKSKFFVFNDKGGDTCVIVEDIISGKLCARHHSSYVLLGSSISDAGLAKIRKFKKFIIFMDDDKPEVKMNQIKIQKKLELFGTVRVIHRGTDPKNLGSIELKEILC